MYHSDISSSVGPGKSRLVSASKGHRHSGRRHGPYNYISLCVGSLPLFLLLLSSPLWSCSRIYAYFYSTPHLLLPYASQLIPETSSRLEQTRLMAVDFSAWFQREFLAPRRLIFNFLFYSLHLVFFALGWYLQVRVNVGRPCSDAHFRRGP